MRFFALKVSRIAASVIWGDNSGHVLKKLCSDSEEDAQATSNVEYDLLDAHKPRDGDHRWRPPIGLLGRH